MKAGDVVTASYKTGTYIGIIEEVTSTAKAAVKIAAVVEHPTQGDLHNPMQASVPFFHQRRALAHGEIALMPIHTISPYDGEIPEYRASLQKALEEQIAELSKHSNDPFAQRSIQELQELAKDYFGR